MVLTYAIKSAITLALLYLSMMPILEKENFHRFNRLLVVGSILFSLFLPFMHIPRESMESFVGRVTNVPVNFSVVVSDSDASEVLPEGWSWVEIATAFYLFGVLVVVLVAIFQTINLMRYMHRGTHFEDGQGNTIVLQTGKVSPFCFFRYIVMSLDDYEHYHWYILTHEQEHIRLHHYVDLLILAVATAAQWFNPFVWILGKELKAIHEYEADEAVINHGIDATQYQRFLVQKAVGNRLQLFANNLNRGSLKSRIVMMNQKKSSSWMKFKALAVIPVAMLTINVFALDATPAKVKAKRSKPVKSMVRSDKEEVETMPQFPGGQAALMSFLMKNVKYPESAKSAKVEGKSIVGFIVKKDGSIEDVVITKSAGSKVLDAEAIRVVKSMPKWRPGIQNGKPVEVQFFVPLIFRLN